MQYKIPPKVLEIKYSQSQIFSLHISFIHNNFAIKVITVTFTLFEIVFISYKVLENGFQTLENGFQTLEISFQTLEISFQTLEISFQTLENDFQTLENRLIYSYGIFQLFGIFTYFIELSIIVFGR